jgi:metal-sulfur cluster biosynthetic enzyme
MATAAAVAEALRTVIDPELGINLVDLGLVYQIAIARDRARIVLTMTSPACPLSEYMKELVDQAVRATVPDVCEVEVSIVLDPPWSPEMMSAEARRGLNLTP